MFPENTEVLTKRDCWGKKWVWAEILNLKEAKFPGISMKPCLLSPMLRYTCTSGTWTCRASCVTVSDSTVRGECFSWVWKWWWESCEPNPISVCPGMLLGWEGSICNGAHGGLPPLPVSFPTWFTSTCWEYFISYPLTNSASGFLGMDSFPCL